MEKKLTMASIRAAISGMTKAVARHKEGKNAVGEVCNAKERLEAAFGGIKLKLDNYIEDRVQRDNNAFKAEAVRVFGGVEAYNAAMTAAGMTEQVISDADKSHFESPVKKVSKKVSKKAPVKETAQAAE